MGGDSVSIRDKARCIFWDSGLTYEKALTNENIAELCDLLDVAFEKEKKAVLSDPANKIGVYYWEKTIRNKASVRESRIPERGPVCFIQASGGYFESRECVSFNPDVDALTGRKWIGFCGSADDHNTSVVTDAFSEWVWWLKNEAENDDGSGNPGFLGIAVRERRG